MTTIPEIGVLARTLWGEARGEGLMGMYAVASVILNRQQDKRWPDTVAEVCLQPKQFSFHNPNDPNFPKLLTVDHSDPTFAKAYAVAAMTVAGMLPLIVDGANHYLTSKRFDSPDRPPWADPNAVIARIGNHVFLRLP